MTDNAKFLKNILDNWETEEQPDGSQYEIMKVESGNAILLGLHKEKEFAVAKTFTSANTKMAMHIHEGEVQIIGVICGQMEVTLENEIKILKKHDVIVLDKGTPHATFCPIDTWVWTVVMPAIEKYPVGKGN